LAFMHIGLLLTNRITTLATFGCHRVRRQCPGRFIERAGRASCTEYRYRRRP
jgi:hypothetical protein